MHSQVFVAPVYLTSDRMQKVTVRVPASTSNLGPGFDCLGVALRIYNYVTIKRARSTTKLPPIVEEAASHFFSESGIKPFSIACSVVGEVPASRGLGSSATLRIGTLVALNEMTRATLSRQRLFEWCAHLEHHPDNAAPASFGGFTIANSGAHQRYVVSPKLRFVLFVPAFEVRTAEARQLLPATVGFSDAVRTLGNAASVAAALASGEYERLRGSFTDYIHQPYRKKLLPMFDAVVAAAESNGALGAFISGSGSTIAAVTLTNSTTIAEAMLAAADGKGRTLVTCADNLGARLIR